jgi:phospholipid/cholesterol/gamma-HCH transport system substrate-binding protein
MALILKENIVEAFIGALVLAVAGVFIAYAYTHTERGSAQGYEIIAKFPATVGIGVGSDVRISGIKVGSVIAQNLDPKTYQAQLTLSINRTVPLPIDTNAKIASEGLLGGAYVALVPGGSDELLRAGEQIEQTQGSVDLTDLIGRFIYGGGNDNSSSAEDAQSKPDATPAKEKNSLE